MPQYHLHQCPFQCPPEFLDSPCLPQFPLHCPKYLPWFWSLSKREFWESWVEPETVKQIPKQSKYSHFSLSQSEPLWALVSSSAELPVRILKLPGFSQALPFHHLLLRLEKDGPQGKAELKYMEGKEGRLRTRPGQNKHPAPRVQVCLLLTWPHCRTHVLHA